MKTFVPALIVSATLQTVKALNDLTIVQHPITANQHPTITPPVAFRGGDWRRQLRSTESFDACYWRSRGFLTSEVLGCTGASRCSTFRPTGGVTGYLECCVPGLPCTSFLMRCVETIDLTKDTNALTCGGDSPFCKTTSIVEQDVLFFSCTHESQTAITTVFPITTSSSTSSTSKPVPSITGVPPPPSTEVGTSLIPIPSGCAPNVECNPGGGPPTTYSSGLRKEAKIGIGAGLGGGLVFVGGMAYVFRRKNQKGKAHAAQDGAPKSVESTPTQIHTDRMGQPEGMHFEKQQVVARIS
ncbi:hypothetical protein QBC38DRAFT_492638 [Podospora fimiseda]|uniref:Uncharacterized protein n=1 Tax=Podospora fimiseda TaxID=252190 RepID=A0AAN6YN99_9PEZI|nr:hypothetical protein QBC38DRAFT_492638 [Podospora fimiseda]